MCDLEVKMEKMDLHNGEVTKELQDIKKILQELCHP
ncbi:hypothetical protein KC19_5G072500 [Ceratodon purpureus]|uniref:Uncharacterized protein n=1 Tax=Ceratodon purpureus TaxID=3225 RepID=A0A8T0HYT4_CERPU|nr:hypothetical protein KC19_5G072500 [Ceratodon purpureus]